MVSETPGIMAVGETVESIANGYCLDPRGRSVRCFDYAAGCAPRPGRRPAEGAAC